MACLPQPGNQGGLAGVANAATSLVMHRFDGDVRGAVIGHGGMGPWSPSPVYMIANSGEGLLKAWAETPLARFLDSKLRQDKGYKAGTASASSKDAAGKDAAFSTAAASMVPSAGSKGAAKGKGQGKKGKANTAAAKSTKAAPPASSASKQAATAKAGAASAGRPGNAVAADKSKGASSGASPAAPGGGPPLPPWLTGLVDQFKASTAGIQLPNGHARAPPQQRAQQQQKQQLAGPQPAATTRAPSFTSPFQRLASLTAPFGTHKDSDKKGVVSTATPAGPAGGTTVLKATDRAASNSINSNTKEAVTGAWSNNAASAVATAKGPVLLGKGVAESTHEKSSVTGGAKPAAGSAGKVLAGAVAGAAVAKAAAPAAAAAKGSPAAGAKSSADIESPALDGEGADGPSPGGLGSLDHTRKAELGRATWTLLHMLAAQFPEKPTKQQQKDAKELIYILTRIYPCGDCAKHFREIVSQHPPVVSSGFELQQYMCRVHNIVNRSLGKPNFPCHRVDARWGALDCEQDACDLEMNAPVLN